MTKFNKIIMNPPYSGNLHLKILREAMKHIEKEGGEVINLSPIRWLQDPLAEYKRNSDWKKFEDIRGHIESIEEIKATDAIRLFNAGFYTNLGIYHITSNGGWKGFQRNKLLDKLIFSDCPKFSYKEPEDKPFKIVLPATHGHAGCDDWSEITSKIFEIARKVQAKSKTNDYIVMAFDTEKELRNFYDSLFLKVYKYIVKNIKTTGCTAQYIKFVPLLPTYAHPWTDADLYEYFGLNEEEIKEIEKEMK